MADPSTGWFEISEITDEKVETAARELDRTWLCRYPHPDETIYGNMSSFLGEKFQELLESYGTTPVPTTIRNPQANFVERVHEMLGNMLRTMILENYKFDPEDYEGRSQNPPSKNRKCPSMKASSVFHNHSQLSERRFHSMNSNDTGPPS